jgi:secreted trypsin-like serine protease
MCSGLITLRDQQFDGHRGYQVRNQPRRKLLFLFLASALTMAAVGGTAGPAAASDDGPSPVRPRIVGGNEAPPGAWPSQVAVLFHDEPDNRFALHCGGTVLSATWVLTAGHCMFFDGGAPIPLVPADLDVLSSTQSLTSGGTRTRAAQLKVAPGFDWNTLKNDLALIHLARPVRAPAMPYAASGDTIPTGTDLVTTGWGETESATYPVKLRQVHVPADSDAACAGAYGESFIASAMFCAGDMVTGQKDSCSGDSGGPISRKVDGRWVQVGIVSWGPYPCGDPDQPGVYTRLSTFSNWVGNQTRLGPHRNVPDAARSLLTDFTGETPTPDEAEPSEEVLSTSGAFVLAAYLVASPGWQSSAGDVARLYRAYFGRSGDTSGLTYWTRRVQTGSSIGTLSSMFAASTEFLTTYGDLTSQEFVDLVYQNTLGRPADASGLEYWTDRLLAGTLTRAGLMTMFAASSEFRRRTDASVNVTVTYLALVRRSATTSEITKWSAFPNANLTRYLIDSYAYASRF